MATTNDEFTETALQRLSKTEKRFNLTRNHRFVVLPSAVKSVDGWLMVGRWSVDGRLVDGRLVDG